MLGTKKRTDVVIIGGGMVGLALTCALSEAGIASYVVEKDNLDDQLLPAFDGRVSAISLGSERVLDAIGAWQYMLPEAEPISDIRVVDGYSTAYAHYNFKDVGDVPVGHMVENRHLRIGLVKAARTAKHVTLHTSASVKNIMRDDYKAIVTLEDGTEITAALLCACDGKRSKTRADAGIKVHEAGYNQTAIVCTIEHTLSHEGLALERFLPHGPFAVLPMKGGMRSAVVWSEEDAIAKQMLALDKKEFEREIKVRLGDYLGDIECNGKRFSYPLFLSLADTYIDKRLALVGDSAHGIHPIAGQGVNVGFRDVAVIAELLEDTMKLGGDMGSQPLLQHYQQWRRFDIVSMGAVTDGITRLFSNDLKSLTLGRRTGLKIVENIPPLKRVFMRHAMGLMGDLPRMMQDKNAA